MSDMMQGNPEEAMKAVENNRSIFNPTDGAAMAQQGQITKDMTVGMFMENVFGVKWEDPVQKLVEASKNQVQNRDPMKKMQNIAGGRMPQGRPPMVQPGGQTPPGGQTGTLNDIVNQFG